MTKLKANGVFIVKLNGNVVARKNNMILNYTYKVFMDNYFPLNNQSDDRISLGTGSIAVFPEQTSLQTKVYEESTSTFVSKINYDDLSAVTYKKGVRLTGYTGQYVLELSEIGYGYRTKNLFSRVVLDNPISVTANDTLTVEYTIEFVVDGSPFTVATFTHEGTQYTLEYAHIFNSSFVYSQFPRSMLNSESGGMLVSPIPQVIDQKTQFIVTPTVPSGWTRVASQMNGTGTQNLPNNGPWKIPASLTFPPGITDSVVKHIGLIDWPECIGVFTFTPAMPVTSDTIMKFNFDLEITR